MTAASKRKPAPVNSLPFAPVIRLEEWKREHSPGDDPEITIDIDFADFGFSQSDDILTFAAADPIKSQGIKRKDVFVCLVTDIFDAKDGELVVVELKGTGEI